MISALSDIFWPRQDARGPSRLSYLPGDLARPRSTRAPWVPVAFFSQTAQSSPGNSRRTQTAPRNVSPVSSGGHLSPGIVQGERRGRWKGDVRVSNLNARWCTMNTASLITKFSLCGGGGVTRWRVMKLRRAGLRSLWDLLMPRSSRRERGEEVPPGTCRLYFFWPPCQLRLNVYTSSSSLLLLHCCLSASIPQGLGEGGGIWGGWGGGREWCKNVERER